MRREDAIALAAAILIYPPEWGNPRAPQLALEQAERLYQLAIKTASEPGVTVLGAAILLSKGYRGGDYESPEENAVANASKMNLFARDRALRELHDAIERAVEQPDGYPGYQGDQGDEHHASVCGGTQTA